MTHYIGATGLDIFEDAIAEAIDDLTYIHNLKVFQKANTVI